MIIVIVVIIMIMMMIKEAAAGPSTIHRERLESTETPGKKPSQ